MKEDRDERTIKEIIEYLKKQNGNCSNELSNVEGLCLVNYIEWLQKEKDRLGKLFYERNEENIRLNNIINKGIEAINVYQNEKTLSIGYQDLKRIRGILRGNEFDLKIFEEYLQELTGVDKE